jgi:enoyl-CoA hydratase
MVVRIKAMWEGYPIFNTKTANNEAFVNDEAFGILRTELADIFAAISPADSEVKAVLDRVSQFPFAASIFLQLLRHNERCCAEGKEQDALFAESLAYSTLQASAEFKQWLSANRAKQIVAAVSNEEPLTLTREKNILTVEFNRPQARNAYSAAMRDALFEALSLLDADTSIETCVIKGAGDCFCVGGDLAEFGLATDPALAHVIRSTRNVAQLLMKNAARIECRVHRACIGSGIELPAFASKVIASEDTFFQLPELSMGLIPGAGGTVSVLCRIGRQRLAWWVLSGKKIKAQTALEWGLIDQVV